jgi:hypothetical protein
MTISFRTLCTLEVTHEYYGGLCRDFDFIIPADTAQQLRNGRSIAKALDGRLHLLFETGEGGGPLVGIAGRTLRIGLALRNPSFANYTAPGGVASSALAVYRRDGGETELADPIAAVAAGGRFAHAPEKSDRPVTVTVTDPSGQEIVTQTLSTSAQPAVSLDFTGRPPGLYTFTEDYPAAVPVVSRRYFHPELTPDAAVVVEIDVDSTLYEAAQPVALRVAFIARSEPLNYYVVAREYSAVEFNQLTVVDEGTAPKLTFTRIDAAAFTPAEITPAMLGNGDVKIALFRSSLAARRARGRARLELRRNNDVIIPNLPQPGADRPGADIIVHVSKKP